MFSEIKFPSRNLLFFSKASRSIYISPDSDASQVSPGILINLRLVQIRSSRCLFLWGDFRSEFGSDFSLLSRPGGTKTSEHSCITLVLLLFGRRLARRFEHSGITLNVSYTLDFAVALATRAFPANCHSASSFAETIGDSHIH